MDMERQFSFWEVYGLRWRDLWGAIFALPAGIGFGLEFLDRLGFDGVVAALIANWRDSSRAFWRWIADAVGWNAATFEMDALTLTVLALLATIGSILTRSGQPYFELARNASRGQSDLTRTFHSFMAIWIVWGVANYFVRAPGPSFWITGLVGTVLIYVFLNRTYAEHTRRRALVQARAASETPTPAQEAAEPEDGDDGDDWRIAAQAYLDRQLDLIKIGIGVVILEVVVFTAFALSPQLGTTTTIIMLVCVGATCLATLVNWRSIPLIILNAIAIVAFDALATWLAPFAAELRRAVESMG